MALIESGSNCIGIFLQPFLGKISVKSKQQKDGYTLRSYVLPSGVAAQSWVKSYESISGKLVRVQYSERENEGKKIQSWKLLLNDGENVINFEFGVKSNVARCWLRITPKIDLSKDIELTCFIDKKDGKKTVLLVKQNGETLKFAYTKENPNGMPPPKVRATGALDFGDTEEWLHNRNLEFAEKVSKANPNFVQNQVSTTQPIAVIPTNRIIGFDELPSTGDQYRSRDGVVLTIQFADKNEISFYSSIKDGIHKLTTENWVEFILPKYTLQEPVVIDDDHDAPF